MACEDLNIPSSLYPHWAKWWPYHGV